MPEQVLAAVKLDADAQMELREFPMPEVQPDTALLKVQAAGMCGSYDGYKHRRYKGVVILGHENVGIIAKAGKVFQERHGVKEGDLVALEEYLPCYHCDWCRVGEYRLCWLSDRMQNPTGYHYGKTPIDKNPALWGGYSQYMYLAPNSVLHLLPSTTSPDAAALALPLGNGVQWAVVEAGARPGRTILIQGPGPKGLGCTLASKNFGADCVIVTGLTKDVARLAAAHKLGADFTVDVEKEDFTTRIMEITGGRGVDAVVDCTPATNSKVFLQSFDVLKRTGGTVATQAYEVSDFSFRKLANKYVTVKMCRGHSHASVHQAVEWIISGKYALDQLMTHHYGINDVARACLASGGEGVGEDAIGVVVNPWL